MPKIVEGDKWSRNLHILAVDYCDNSGHSQQSFILQQQHLLYMIHMNMMINEQAVT